MSEAPMKQPWLIRMHYRMRTISFALMFVATALHGVDQSWGLVAWLLLVGLFLIYPHVQYWRACRAKKPILAALQNLRVDAFLLGIFVAALAFSQWLAFSAMLGALSNHAANKGWRGVGESVIALLLGVGLGIAIFGFRFAPQTGGAATLVCIFGLAGYLLAMSRMSFARNVHLRTAREHLKLREQELLKANLSLVQNLREIDALQVQLREQALRDPLTGLYNRRYLDTSLERELARCKRDGEPLSLLMLDVDHFKQFNDHYGHQAGDECLKRVALALQEGARRASDLVARYGGEEFSLVLPNTDAAVALQLAEAIRHAIAELELDAIRASLGHVTVSIGIATRSADGDKSVAQLLREADEALYRAKAGGRNRVCLAALDASAVAGADCLSALDQLVWHSGYECEHALIDEQHQALFGHANELLGRIIAGQDKAVLAASFQALIGEVVRHFEDEEKIIAAGSAAHLSEHRNLLDRAARMSDQFGAGFLEARELFQFIAYDLIVHHLLGSDKSLFAQLQLAAEET